MEQLNNSQSELYGLLWEYFSLEEEYDSWKKEKYLINLQREYEEKQLLDELRN